MEPFKTVTSNICPLDIPNIDTDQIIPKQFLKRVERTGFGQFLFYDWRFLDNGEENLEFNLNKPEFRDAKILLAEDNFGCGSSREHAPWALQDFGYKVIIAPSYADIFYNNCFQNGILPIVLEKEEVANLFKLVNANPQNEFTVDLEEQKLSSKEITYSFEIDEEKKNKLLKGLDDIAFTLQFDKEISAYESQRLF